MKKELIRKEFFKLKIKGHSYSQCSKIIYGKFKYEVAPRTLQRWMNKLDNSENWDLKDESRRPNKIHRKISLETEKEIIAIRNKTGWGENKIADLVDVSSWSVNT